VLKVLVAPTKDSATAPVWQGEALTYESGLLDTLPDGLRAPRCFGVTRPEPGRAELWLEDLGSVQGPPFTPEQYRVLAHGLGAVAGAYLTARGLPDFPWLRRGTARRFVSQAAQQMAMLNQLRDNPLVQRAWPADHVARILQVHDGAAALLTRLEALPQTLCHQDAVPRNLFIGHAANGVAEAIAIDWGLAGIGALGSDLSYLVAGGVHFFDLAPDALPEVEAVALDSYLEGLADAGWDGAARDVQLAYLLSLGLRYGIHPFPLLVTDERYRRLYERSIGRPVEDILDVGLIEQRFCLDRLDQARTLLAAST
jgi:hypothetical protein